MRRAIPIVLSAVVFLSACGGGDDTSESSEPAEESSEPADTTGVSESTTDAPAGTSETPPADTSEAEPADTSETPPADTSEAEPADTDYPDKPDVKIPDEVPTGLKATTLIEGSGPEAEAGDVVIVDYVGVRTVDGVEFDSSYERQAPFAVTLGRGDVIVGWDDGLVGTQTGQRIQLDIPSDLAYGEQARDDVIGADEPLTFVIDVRAVVQADPADAPTEAGAPESEGATEVSWEDLIVGDGETLEEGETAVFHIVVFRGDNLQPLTSSWADTPIQLRIAEPEFPGLVLGMPGMKVGGRRSITIPPEEGFGVEGNPPMGLPAETDIIIVVDLLGRY